MPTLIDLSHPLLDGQAGYPGDPELSIQPFDTIAGSGYNTSRISLSSHHGTHCDAPYHVFDDGWTLDTIPLDRFYGPAALVDLAPASMLPAGTAITVEMLRPFEAKFQPGARVLYRTGWDRLYPQPEYSREHPSLTLEAAQWIAKRRIGLLGMDAAGPSVDWRPVHHVLLEQGAEIVLVESLANLHLLPEHFTFVGFPLGLIGRDGSPLRAVGVLE